MAWYLDNDDLLVANDQPLYAHRYIKADYIEFNWGTNGGWIDVGLPAYTDTSWHLDFAIMESVADNWIIGAANHSIACAELGGTQDGSSWFTGHNVTYNTAYAVGVKTRASVTGDAAYKRTDPFNLYIGCANWATTVDNPTNSPPSHYRVYAFYMSRGGIAQRDMHPAYDTVNEEWGLYDTISGTFFGNAGGEGTSIAGGYFPEPIDQTPEVLAFDYNDPPIAMWRLVDDILVNGLLPEPLVDDQGAFNKCLNLVYVEIPESVKSIGRYSFRETALSSVKIASDCTYYETSFPAGCTIKHY